MKVKSDDIMQYVWDSTEEHYDSHIALWSSMALITPQVSEFPAKKWIQKGKAHGEISIKEVKGQSVSCCTFFIVRKKFTREQRRDRKYRRLDLEYQT